MWDPSTILSPVYSGFGRSIRLLARSYNSVSLIFIPLAMVFKALSTFWLGRINQKIKGGIKAISDKMGNLKMLINFILFPDCHMAFNFLTLSIDILVLISAWSVLIATDCRLMTYDISWMYPLRLSIRKSKWNSVSICGTGKAFSVIKNKIKNEIKCFMCHSLIYSQTPPPFLYVRE